MNKFLLVLGFVLFVFAIKAQNKVLLPSGKAVSNWVLSTGNWQKDPQLYVLELGEGSDTIIMLHGGWGGEHSGLVSAVEDLKNQFHFIFYDQRGSLRSPCPDSLVTFNHHIEDLELLRQELNLDKLSIVGHSMGAVLACAYATKYPQHIKRLVLLSPAGLKYPLPETDKALVAQSWKMSDAFMNRKEVNQELEKYQLNREKPGLSSREETIKYRINLGKRMLYDITKWPLLNESPHTFKGHLFSLVEATYPAAGWDYINEFKKQGYPVGIIIGHQDFLDFENHLIKKYASEVPRVKLSVIENAGHFLWLDQPKVFAKTLQLYLR